MTTQNRQRNQHFCIFDYYLDGVFLRWQEVEGECPLPVVGEQWTVDLEDGTQVTGKIEETIAVSENERRILLRSC
ncbi:hypothetical protein IQ255_11235 [Pleurocapsales cyanobacterium LEGE 10410]|nr:hypothetical protein [Pleurocapsales cyanobacterium LEGE 10410]